MFRNFRFDMLSLLPYSWRALHSHLTILLNQFTEFIAVMRVADIHGFFAGNVN